MTLNITTLSIMTLCITTLSIMTLSITTLSITTLSIMTLSITTLRITTLNTECCYDVCLGLWSRCRSAVKVRENILNILFGPQPKLYRSSEIVPKNFISGIIPSLTFAPLYLRSGSIQRQTLKKCCSD